jgi:hypothetical protein
MLILNDVSSVAEMIGELVVMVLFFLFPGGLEGNCEKSQ